MPDSDRDRSRSRKDLGSKQGARPTNRSDGDDSDPREATVESSEFPNSAHTSRGPEDDVDGSLSDLIDTPDYTSETQHTDEEYQRPREQPSEGQDTSADEEANDSGTDETSLEIPDYSEDSIPQRHNPRPTRETDDGTDEDVGPHNGPNSQEYIRITPVREPVNSETVTRELYGLHKYGDGRKLPLDMERHIEAIQGAANYEFIVYKPAGKSKFEFFFGPGEVGDVNCDRLESATRSQYPDNFEFEREQFDVSSVFEDTPHMVRFEGREERRKDWMTTLTTFDLEEVDRSPMSNLLETAIQTDGAVVFQVIFEPRSDWSVKAERQKNNLKQGAHSTAGLIARSAFESVVGVSDEARAERHRGDTPDEIGGSIHDSQTAGQRHGTSRMGQIDLKNPANTFNVTVRAATSLKESAEYLSDSLNHLSGQFYSLKGEYLERNELEYTRMCEHGLTLSNGYEMVTRQKPILVCNVQELANFITVPSIDSIPKASRAGTGGSPVAQSPLTSPNEEIFTTFSDGMTIGKAVTAVRDPDDTSSNVSAIERKNEWWDEVTQKRSIGLSAADLTHHYIRAASTGSGKTVATLNDLLSTHAYLDGPTILIDQKGGGMCENYLRCHRLLFGNLDDVEYIKIPEKGGMIPGIPFFDIRPLVEGGGLDRSTAVQNIIDHYFQVLYFALDKDTVEQAFVANEILKNLIKANFDPVHGSDQFSIGKLMESAQAFQRYGKKVEDVDKDAELVDLAVPNVSDDQVYDIFCSHLEKDARQFMNTTDAVLNRIRTLKERDFIWNMLSFEVAAEHWDHETNWYDRNAVPMLDLKSILNSDKVVIIDTGGIMDVSSEMFTTLFLSHLWTAARSLWTPDDDNYIANVVIEESSNIARSEIVYNDLLPKGREFNLSLGLIMQYPEQVLGDDPHANKRAYKEILNNINTKLIGPIATDDLLAESLFHEDLDTDEIKDRISGLRQGEWVVQLPSTGFAEQKPEILTLEPLPIPPGHTEGPVEVKSYAETVRERSRRAHCVSRDHDAVDISSGTRSRATGDDREDQVNGESSDDDDSGSIEEQLTHKHYSYLELVFDSLTDGIEGYNLSKSMRALPFSETASDLVKWGLLEKEYLGNNEVFYKPTKKANIAVDRTFSPDSGGEKGDESLKHRIGVRLAKTYYDQLGYDARMYHSPDGESHVFDVFAYDTPDSPTNHNVVVEVETCPEKRGHVEDDYDKLADAYGDAVWVVENQKAARRLIKSLSEPLENPPGQDDSISRMSRKLDAPGAGELLSISGLRDKV